MPKAAVDEDGLLAADERNVGRAGQVLAMKTVTVAELDKDAADEEFGGGVSGPDASHDLRSGEASSLIPSAFRDFRHRARSAHLLTAPRRPLRRQALQISI